MRIAVGSVWHQTNTFRKTQTTLQAFEGFDYHEDDDVLAAREGTATVLGGVIDAARGVSATIVPTISARAPSGGTVTGEALSTLCDRLCERLARYRDEIDGVVLDLSGALVSDVASSGDVYVLQRVRDALRGQLPVVASLGPHANVPHRALGLATLVVGGLGYAPGEARTQGLDAFRLIHTVVERQLRPGPGIGTLPMRVPLTAQDPDGRLVRDFLTLAEPLAADQRVLAVSLFGGFPYADVGHAGPSVTVFADREPTVAQDHAERIIRSLWDQRDALPRSTENVEAAVHRAMASDAGPVVIADTGDDPGAGGPGDGTALLWALLDLGARDAALAAVTDPAAVAAAFDAGPGSCISVRLGGGIDRRGGYPIDVDAEVVRVAAGAFRRSGPVDAGLPVDLGRVAVLRAAGRHEGDVTVIVTERAAEVDDVAFFRTFGVEPEGKKIVAVKSSLRYRAAYAGIAAEMIAAEAPGITTPDLAFFPFRQPAAGV